MIVSEHVRSRVEIAADRAYIDPERTRQALEVGFRLCVSEGNKRPKLTEIIWRLLQEAVDTHNRLRDPDGVHLKAGDRISAKPVIHTLEELFEAEKARLIDLKESPSLAPLPRLGVGDPTAEARYLTVFSWLRLIRCRKPRLRKSYQKTVLLLAMGLSVKRVRNLCLGPDATDRAVYARRNKVLADIADAVRRYWKGKAK